jgi:diadenosine tetraphosphate (Ap4A) HIT family hydrolase
MKGRAPHEASENDASASCSRERALPLLPELIALGMHQNIEIPEPFFITETDGWSVNHRINSFLPGYLMVSSKTFTNDLSELSKEALSSLGPLLARAQDVLKRNLQAERVYIGRYGHTPGYPIHFHVIPIYQWVEDLLWNDDRYRLLQTFTNGPGESATDGAEMTLFVWREFCERPEPPPIKGPSIADVIGLLRLVMPLQSGEQAAS